METSAIRIDDLRELLIHFSRIFDQDLLRTGLISKPVLGMNFKTKNKNPKSFSVNFPWFHNSKSRRKNCPISTVSKSHNRSRFFNEQTQSNPCSLHKKNVSTFLFSQRKGSDFSVHNCYQLKTDFLWKRVIKFYPKSFSFNSHWVSQQHKSSKKHFDLYYFQSTKSFDFPCFKEQTQS